MLLMDADYLIKPTWLWWFCTRRDASSSRFRLESAQSQQPSSFFFVSLLPFLPPIPRRTLSPSGHLARTRARREVTRERSRAFLTSPSSFPRLGKVFPFRRLTTSALLLLSDYCAAVTAVCRSACIKDDSFSGKYQCLRPA